MLVNVWSQLETTTTITVSKSSKILKICKGGTLGKKKCWIFLKHCIRLWMIIWDYWNAIWGCWNVGNPIINQMLPIRLCDTVGKKYGSFNRVHHKHQMICQSRHLSPEHKHSMLEFSSPSHWDFPRQEAPRCSHSSHWTSTPSLDWALLCSSHAWCRWCWVSLTWKRTKCVLYVHHHASLKLTKIVFPTSISCDRSLLVCKHSL